MPGVFDRVMLYDNGAAIKRRARDGSFGIVLKNLSSGLEKNAIGILQQLVEQRGLVRGKVLGEKSARLFFEKIVLEQ